MNYLFIDSNIYLEFYKSKNTIKGLESLVKLKDNIIVTKQIKDEVSRNSVSVSTQLLNNLINSLEWKKPSLLYHNTKKSTSDLLDKVYPEYTKLKEILLDEINEEINVISKGQDIVTSLLEEIFKEALIPSKEELNEAYIRKRHGNPPGKRTDTVGDELNWIQMRNILKENDRVIIVSNDGDYYSKSEKSLILNSYLYTELAEKKILEVAVHNTISDALNELKRFNELDKIVVEVVYFPNEEELKELKDEEIEIKKEDFK
ncbi:MAG: PIN domain-containing protein, partial [Chitinophagales bacterium]